MYNEAIHYRFKKQAQMTSRKLDAQRTDIHKILIIAPVNVIARLASLNYSARRPAGARQEGYQVVLVNSNPATIRRTRKLRTSPTSNP